MLKTGFLKRNKKIILSVCIVISVIILLYGFGNDFAFLTTPAMDLSGESFGDVIAEGDGSTAVIDVAYSSIVFLNSDKKIVRVIQDGVSSISGTAYKSVVFSNGRYYVCDSFYDSDSYYPKSDHIVIYDTKGKVENTVYEKEFDRETNRNGISVIKLKPCENGVIALILADDNSGITAKKFTDKGEEDIETVALGKEEPYICGADYDENSKTWGFVTASGDGLTYRDGKWETIENNYPLDKVPDEVKIKPDGTVNLVCDEPVKMPGKVYFSAMFLAKAIVFWIAFLFLVALILVFAFRKLKALIVANDMPALMKISVSAVAVAAIVGVSAFYSVEMIHQAIQSRQVQLSTLVSTISGRPDNYLGNILAGINEMNSGTKDQCEAMYDYIDAVGDSRNMEFNSLIRLYKHIDEDTWCRILDNNRALNIAYCGTDMILSRDEDTVQKTLKNGNTMSQIKDTKYGVILASYAPLVDSGGNITGYIMAESDFNLLKVNCMRTVLKNFVTLLAFMVGLALLIVEVAAIIRSRKKRRRLKEEHYAHPEIADFRTIKLFIGFLLKFDSVLMILIAKDLLIHTANASNAVVLGIPAACMALGTLIGQILIDILMPRIHIRKILGVTGVFYAAMLVLTAFSVHAGNFLLYCGGIFFVNVAFGVFAGPSWVMPFMARNEHERFEMNNTKGLADVSASVLSVILAGYAAELFGNFAIYLFALIPLAIVFLCYMRSMPKNTIYGKKADTAEAQEKIKFTKYLRFIFSPGILLLLLLIVFPAVFASGYKSLIFPLFSQKQGLSKPFISNLVVIANFAAFILNGPVEKSLKNNDYWKNTIFIAVLSGVIYISLVLNSSLVWAVVVIALLALTDKLISPNFNMLWPRQAKKLGVPPQRLYSLFIYTDNIASALRPAFIGLFLTIPAPYCNFWLGACFIGCALLFAICTGRSVMNKPIEI